MKKKKKKLVLACSFLLLQPNQFLVSLHFPPSVFSSPVQSWTFQNSRVHLDLVWYWYSAIGPNLFSSVITFLSYFWTMETRCCGSFPFFLPSEKIVSIYWFEVLKAMSQLVVTTIFRCVGSWIRKICDHHYYLLISIMTDICWPLEALQYIFTWRWAAVSYAV